MNRISSPDLLIPDRRASIPVATRPEADEAAFGNIKSKLPDTPDQDSGVLQFHCIGKCPDQDGEPDLLHLRDQHGRKKTHG